MRAFVPIQDTSRRGFPGRRGWTIASAGAILILSLSGSGARAAQREPGPSGPLPPESMSGLSFDGLTADQKALAVSILNETDCDCSCGMKLAVCRRDDATCSRSLSLARHVIKLVKQGKSREEILKDEELTRPAKSERPKFIFGKKAKEATVAQAPPGGADSSNARQLTAHEAPSRGPVDARVTILHYMDYE